jgi:hypothetical protein
LQRHFAIKRLATGPQVHCAEQGDPGGHALDFAPGWPDWKRPERVASDLDAFLRAAYALLPGGPGARVLG